MRRKFLVILALSFMMPSLSSFAQGPKAADKNFLILGVIASSKGKAGVALMKDRESQKTFAMKEGDEFDKGKKIVAVKRKSVDIMVNGRRLTLKVGEETADAESQYNSGTNPSLVAHSGDFEVRGETIKVTSQFKNHLVNEKLDTILMSAATVPFVRDGKLQGFTLWDIEPNSLFEKFGLKDGDTVTQINEHEIRDLSSTLKLLTSLKTADEASFKFLRNGQEKLLNIVIQ